MKKELPPFLIWAKAKGYDPVPKGMFAKLYKEYAVILRAYYQGQ